MVERVVLRRLGDPVGKAQRAGKLLTDSGTWEGTAESVVLHLGKGDVTLTVSGSANLTGTASDFDIADFETINFDFYG